MSLSIVIFVATSDKYIDVFVTGERVRSNSLNRDFVGMNCSLPKVASVSCGYVVMISGKYIDVLVTRATSSRRLHNP